MYIIFLSVLLQFVKAQIYYDTGYYTGFDSNACNAGQSQTKTISFSGTFQKVSQVFYFLRKFSLSFSGAVEEAQITSEIVSTTATNFQVKVSCPLSTGLSSTYKFQWYATCVPRITVIKSNIVANIKNGSTTQGFAMLTDLQYNVTFDFYLSVYSVTSTDLKIKFVSYIDNLPINIGYFVVIGPTDAFSRTSTYQTPEGSGNVLYSSGNLAVPTDGILIAPSSGFGWSTGPPQIYIIISQTAGSSTAAFQVGTFSPSYSTGVSFIRIWIFDRVIYPMYVHNYRVTQIEYLRIDVPIKIILNGQTYNQIENTYKTYLLLHKSQKLKFQCNFSPIQCYKVHFQNVMIVELILIM